MTTLQKLANVFISLLMIAFGAILLLNPAEEALVVALLALAFVLMFYGIHMLFDYLTLSRHMVSGKVMLYIGIITLDMGVFSLSIYHASKTVVLLYLLGCHAITGATSIARAIESRMHDSPWKLMLSQGIVSIVILIACLRNMNNPTALIYILSAWLFYSALMRLVNTFKSTEIIYIA